MAKIAHQRVLQLHTDLLKATAPSKKPDPRYRPSEWNDRIYYVFQEAGVHEGFFQNFGWEGAPLTVASAPVFQLESYDKFEAVETIVARILSERAAEGI